MKTKIVLLLLFIPLMLGVFYFVPSVRAEAVPYLNSIASPVVVGQVVTVTGTNLSGFEGDKNLWIVSSSGQKAIIRGDSGSSDNMITFKLLSLYCNTDTSYSGTVCPSEMFIVPGTYTIYAQPWGIMSNKVTLNILPLVGCNGGVSFDRQTGASCRNVPINCPNGVIKDTLYGPTCFTNENETANSALIQQLMQMIATLQRQIYDILHRQATPAPTPTPTVVSPAGMRQFTDPDFGFSFWYPSSWKLQETSDRNKNVYTGGSVIRRVTVVPPDLSTMDGLSIEEFTSDGKTITDNSGCGPAEGCPSSKRYYFDSSIHTWMQESFFQYGQSSTPSKISAADVSNNSMGGLHILKGNARFGDNVIVPLSAKNFVIVSNLSAGANRVEYLANTIVALDPAVATPQSDSEQKMAIHKEGVLYGALGASINNGEWFKDDQYVYDRLGNVVAGANASAFRAINNYSDGYVGQSAFATDGVRIYYAGSKGAETLQGADPNAFVLIRQQYQIPYAPSSGKYGQSFTSYDTTYEKDNSHVWDGDKLVPGADPNTFVVTGNTLVKNSSGGYTLAHDAHHSYGEDEKGNVTVYGL